MLTRLKAFVARNIVPLTIFFFFLAIALGGLIPWTYFAVFAAGWALGMLIYKPRS